MDLVQEMISALQGVIRVGALTRITFCLVKGISNEEEAPMYKKRARNAFIFALLAELVWELRDLVAHYYG